MRRVARRLRSLNVGADSECEQWNQQSPCQHATGKVQRGQPRTNDVSHAQIRRAYVRAVNSVAPPVTVVATFGLRTSAQQQFFPQFADLYVERIVRTRTR